MCMKCVILAGGLGTRLSEETVIKPKPMVEIGGFPILLHVMKIYSHFGINEFIICLGYKGYIIKEYFANYCLHMSDITFDMRDGSVQVHSNYAEPWKVTCVDTGDNSMTGGRIKRIQKYVGNETFCLTYGDGVGDVQIDKELEFHKKMNRKATMTSVKSPVRFGHAEISGDIVSGFREKSQGDGGWINGGFFVLEPDIFNLIDGDSTIWEREPLEMLASKRQLASWKHDSFWRPMDTLRDKMYLEELWQNGTAPWKLWQ